MKKLKLNRQLGVIALVVFLLSVLLFLILRGKAGEFGVNAIEKIVVNKNGTSITLEKGGSFTFRDKDNVYKDRWEAPKASVFIKYFKENYGGQSSFEDGVLTVILSSQDELFEIASGEVYGGSGGSGGDSGTEDLSDYFEDGATPTPIPTSTPTPTATPAGGGTASPTPTPTSGPYDPDLCVHWHMSYCVGESSPTPTPTPAGYEEGTLPPECGSNLETGRTVISNILCIIE
ncbi:MAG: Blue (Type 1) copper domain protein [Candidatus Woesebacteria bacterium GW2011_GWB1_43_14]|uniref:Blue (Type 1) copper domain protein n=1 Tax=Candidatus Woesebacteria bacterium GW2011_GWB1_43_14 TaxID=1618578 RepID=A0A0G1DHX3_9BACT|nr:MAG: Blue (Type 1) copper domain protein [Candidatus Woesebacteria bacterium GW2011_GWA1_39_11b]KKS78286.1 MAG: Blue (Type 1) copper domain protein [Candidatus Woesebacteria bacterium GW2011_GWC1_42_9]KKS97294.1 MAG: Blue (Type 1) copper domain protein [Candidatus Woesebacteria bacterium GW2011_GWB1_43_14]